MGKSPKEIADILGGYHRGPASLANAVEHYWPTIEAALLAYEPDTEQINKSIHPINPASCSSKSGGPS